MSSSEVVEKIVVPFLAAFLGALAAFVYQRKLKKDEYKMNVLATLMSYRHRGHHEDEFVRALNLIDIVFHDSKRVKEALHTYLTYTGKLQDVYSNADRINSFLALLIEMGRDIGYKDLKRSDIEDFYFPPIEIPKQEPKENERMVS